MSKSRVLGLGLVLLALGAGETTVPRFKGLTLPANAGVGASSTQVARALGLQPADKSWKPGSAKKSRGAGGTAYPRVAPSVVVVRVADGHGTGFVVDAAGFILTNHHVIEGAAIDPATGAPTATIHFGRLVDGLMHLVDPGVPALVVKDDPDKDLALLKLTHPPEGVTLVAVPLSKQEPTPGSDCVAIGHPAAGLLWTVRSCEVSGVGTWPAEHIDNVMHRLAAATAEERAELTQLVEGLPSRKILLSSCGINPGDSGGPLVSAQGELLAVTFAIPRGDPSEGISLDKFSYHVHLDEVRAFLAERPSKPLLAVPDPWPPGVYSALIDLDGDGRSDTLGFGVERGKPITGLVADLDQNSPADFSPKMLENPQLRARWDFEFSLQTEPTMRAFYDTDDDGTIDVVLVDADRDGRADGGLRRQGGTWTQQNPQGSPLLNPRLVPAGMQGRFIHLLKAVSQS
ncbi:MAG TPA: serine protease [Candidatus Polarisedimenticolaceae bacterium]|nr:serine protease [Candidatus Polarisedimenticolaceae bacterium]